jgi:hypothetical protein
MGVTTAVTYQNNLSHCMALEEDATLALWSFNLAACSCVSVHLYYHTAYMVKVRRFGLIGI